MLRNLRDSLKYSKKVIHSNIEASKLKICFIKQLFLLDFSGYWHTNRTGLNNKDHCLHLGGRLLGGCIGRRRNVPII